MSEPSVRRLREVAKRHAPRGWRLSPTGIHPREGDGIKSIAYADFNTKTIVHPEIVDRGTLAVFLHECGHAHHKHGIDTDHHAVEHEWEAEIYARKAMRAAGIPVPRWVQAHLRNYLRNIIEDLYAEPIIGDKGYAVADVDVPDHILRYVYGPRWRSHTGRVDKSRKRR